MFQPVKPWRHNRDSTPPKGSQIAGQTFEEKEVFLKELDNENIEQDVPVTVDEVI